MRHRLRGRQLSRDTEHRKALRRNLAQSLFEHGSIKTTLPKAKEVQSFIEKLITAARKGVSAQGENAKIVKLNARRKVIAMMNDRRLVDENQDFIEKGNGPRSGVEKLFDEVAPKAAATGWNGTIPFRSPATCSRSSPATSSPIATAL